MTGCDRVRSGVANHDLQRRIGSLAAAFGLLAAPGPGHGQTSHTPGQANIEALIAEASARFALPPNWIAAVMRAESAFDPHAVSSAGALGLMQVMPRTYAELRIRHGLGPDPFDPRDNILAGAAYLREMYDRFGAPGFLAAYNSGPRRYQAHLSHARPLPPETRRYVAAVAPAVVGQAGPAEITSRAEVPSVFVSLGGGSGASLFAPVSIPRPGP